MFEHGVPPWEGKKLIYLQSNTKLCVFTSTFYLPPPPGSGGLNLVPLLTPFFFDSLVSPFWVQTLSSHLKLSTLLLDTLLAFFLSSSSSFPPARSSEINPSRGPFLSLDALDFFSTLPYR
jgi:hypothetical protein